MEDQLTEFDSARKEGFIGVEGDIYVRQLTKNHAVAIEKVENYWISYRIHWKEEGKIQRTVDLCNPTSFKKALLEAKRYVDWFQNKGNERIRKIRFIKNP